MLKYFDAYQELKKREFAPIKGANLYEYLSQFTTVEEQIEFLQEVSDHVEVEGGVYIHPDSVDGACFLSRFFDQEGIRELFLATVPFHLSKLKEEISNKPLPINFKPSISRNKLRDIIECLIDIEVMDDQVISFDEITKALISENVLDSNVKIKFKVDMNIVSYLFEEKLFKQFTNLTRRTVEDSMMFIQKKPNKGNHVFIGERSLRNAAFKRKSKEISNQWQKKINSAFE